MKRIVITKQHRIVEFMALPLCATAFMSFIPAFGIKWLMDGNNPEAERVIWWIGIVLAITAFISIVIRHHRNVDKDRIAVYLYATLTIGIGYVFLQ